MIGNSIFKSKKNNFQRDLQKISQYYISLINSEPQEEFLILNHNLKGVLNTVNPFLSQVISIEKSLIVSKLSSKSKSINFNIRNSSLEPNTFKILNKNTNENKTTADLVKNSINKKNTLFISKNYGSSISKMSINNSKSFMNNNHQKLIQQIFKRNSNVGSRHSENDKLEKLENLIKKSRTPLLRFIDSKNFIIAGKDFLRVFHLSENLW